MEQKITEQTLTAFALGELSPDEAAGVEAYRADHPGAREFVAEIELTAGRVRSALADEQATSLTLPQRAAILQAATSAGGVKERSARRALAIAACLALAAGAAIYMAYPAVGFYGRLAYSGGQAPAVRGKVFADVVRVSPATQPFAAAVSSEEDASSPHQSVGAAKGERAISSSPTAAAPIPPAEKPKDGLGRDKVAPLAIYANPEKTPTKLDTRVMVPDGGTVLLGGQSLADAEAEPGKLPNTGMALPADSATGGGVKELAAQGQGDRAGQLSPKTEVATETKTYDIRDLIVDTPNFDNAPTFDRSGKSAEQEKFRETAQLRAAARGRVEQSPIRRTHVEYSPTTQPGEVAQSAEAPANPQMAKRLPELRFNRVGLGDVVDYMHDVSGMEIAVDWAKLDAAGVHRDSPVSLQLRDVPTQKAMNRILESVAPGKLAYAVDDNRIVISTLPIPANLTPEPFNTESYARIYDNPFLTAIQNPLSTFSIDVDTASYANLRRFINGGQLPPPDAVRIEEMVNYFSYDYPQPKDDAPFAANVEVAGCPWNADHRLVRIGLRGRDADAAVKETPKNLVFLIDVSGSMMDQNKLPLLKESMKMLVKELSNQDRVTIAVYAGNSGLVLPTTVVGAAGEVRFDADAVSRKLWTDKYAPKITVVNGEAVNADAVAKEFQAESDRIHESARGTGRDLILAAIDRLEAGGSTNGAAGIQLAYDRATSAFIKGGVNRVILCTDGDFNVGITNQGDLTRLIETKAKSGVFLSVLGFGMGNVKDSTMENLADKGNGNYAYIDTLKEAKKVLVDQMDGTLVTIAKDVKIQVEFNPAKVGSYRLIGYENRMLAKEDFNDDKKDAGEIGSGHTVTALYEVTPAGMGVVPEATPGVDPLKYDAQPKDRLPANMETSNELLTLKLRYKAPDAPLEQGTSKLLEFPVTDTGETFAAASTDFKFASAVAAFGMILRDSPHKGTATLSAVQEIAQASKGEDKAGYRGEFVDLVKKAVELKR